MRRCWWNPEARGCKTCKHFNGPYADWGDECDLGVDLSGRPACENCHGQNYVFTGEMHRQRFQKPGRVMGQCPKCKGDGAEIKPGPIIHCEKWEARDAG